MTDRERREILGELTDLQVTAICRAICPHCKAGLPDVLDEAETCRSTFRHVVPGTEDEWDPGPVTLACRAEVFRREVARARNEANGPEPDGKRGRP